MRRKDGLRKLLALLLVFAMILGDSSMTALADVVGNVTQEKEKETAGSGEESETETEAATEKAAETESNTEAATEKAAETESNTEASTGAGTEAAAETESEASTEKVAEPEAETATEAAPETDSEAGTEKAAETESEASTEAATETESEAGTEAATETESEADTEAATETESEAGTEAATETESESESEAESDSTAETAFRYSDDSVTVEAAASEEAGVPQDAVLKADYLDPVSYEYEDAIDAFDEQLADALGVSGDENLAVDYFLYDVYFEADGERVEPETGSVKVTMAFQTPQLSTLATDYEDAEFISAAAVHLKNDGTAEIVTDYVNTDENGAVSSLGFTLGSFSVMGAAVVYRVSGSADAEQIDETTTGLALEKYVTEVTIKYSTDDGTTWTTYTGKDEETIPANATIRLEVHYGDETNKKISISDIKKNSNTFTFTLPDFLKDATTGGSITVAGKTIGSINVADGKVVITLDESFVNEQDSSYTSIGEFWVQGKVNIKNIDVPGLDKYTWGGRRI